MSEPRGIRNNNPFNIDFVSDAFDRDPWRGELGLEDHDQARFTTFERPVFGIRAGVKLIRNYHRLYDARSVRDVIDRFAPPIENETEAYIQHVAGACGCGADDAIDFDNPRILTAMAEAIIRHENGRQPYDADTIADGVQMALA